MTSPSVPVPDKISFENALDNVRYFRKQWLCYCKATGIEKWPEESKLNFLYLLIGSEAFKVISNLPLSAEEKGNTEMLLTALENYCKPFKNVVYERYKFNLTVQNEAEDVDSYLRRLRKLASSCEYGQNTEDMIRDRFVAGLRNILIQKDLVADESLTLQKAVTITKLRSHADVSLQTLYQKINQEKQTCKNDDSLPREQLAGQELLQVQVKLEKIDHIENSPTVDTTVQLNVSPSVSALPAVQHITNASEFEPPDKRLKVHVPLLGSSRKEADSSKEQTGDYSRNEEESLPEKRTEIVPTNNPSTITCTADYNIGSFVILKTDYHKDGDPPIWKIDSNSLLQKFEPFEQDGVILYKSKSVYSGWSQNARSQYYRTSVIVKGRHPNRKENIVQFLKESVEQENVVEKKKSLTPCDKKNGILKKR